MDQFASGEDLLCMEMMMKKSICLKVQWNSLQEWGNWFLSVPAVKRTEVLNVWHTKLSENRAIQDWILAPVCYQQSKFSFDHSWGSSVLSVVMIWVWLQKGNQVKNGFKKSFLSSYVKIFHNKCVSRLLKQI